MVFVEQNIPINGTKTLTIVPTTSSPTGYMGLPTPLAVITRKWVAGKYNGRGRGEADGNADNIRRGCAWYANRK